MASGARPPNCTSEQCRPPPGTLTKADREAARQRAGERQTPLASQLLWAVIFHRIQTLADFFSPKNWEKCKQQKQFHSVATNLTNAVHHCTFALLSFCFCSLRTRLLSRGEKSDFNPLSVISHINYLSHAAKKYHTMHTASPTNSLKLLELNHTLTPKGAKRGLYQLAS